jgi:hypothetical protein
MPLSSIVEPPALKSFATVEARNEILGRKPAPRWRRKITHGKDSRN